MSAVKNVIKNNFRNMELNEFLATALKDAGYGGVEVQKTPVGARITVYVTRPGLVIGRKGTGIKDLMSKLEQKFGLQNPQISVLEVMNPELNPNIMCNRIAQLIERGTLGEIGGQFRGRLLEVVLTRFAHPASLGLPPEPQLMTRDGDDVPIRLPGRARTRVIDRPSVLGGGGGSHPPVDSRCGQASTADPDIMNPIYGSGDHLHPNDAGYVAVGNAIGLRMLLRARFLARRSCATTGRHD